MASAPVVVTRATFQKALDGQFEAAGDTLSALVAEDREVPVAEALAQLDRVFHQLSREPGAADVMVAPRDQLASLFQSYISQHASEQRKLAALAAGGFEAQYDKNDVAWVTKTGFGWIRQHLKLGRHPWTDNPPPVETIGNSCRIAVLSDWGTAMYGAPICAKSIQADGEFDWLFHLGDVYYSGTAEEIRNQFLSIWPSVNRAKTRCLNGNHEMYSTGKAYFEIVPHFGQRGSYFALQNDHWLLVGLDTAYTDHQLHGNQTAWLMDLVGRAGSRRTVLFSHHQPFSLIEDPADRLIGQLSPLLDSQRIFAWYWGHEHRCVIHDRHPLWGMYGRCVGHSGFPEFRHKSLGEAPQGPTFVRAQRRGVLTPGGLLLDGPNRHIPGHEREYSPHGYVVLEFDGTEIVEEYYEAGGSLLHREELR